MDGWTELNGADNSVDMKSDSFAMEVDSSMFKLTDDNDDDEEDIEGLLAPGRSNVWWENVKQQKILVVVAFVLVLSLILALVLWLRTTTKRVQFLQCVPTKVEVPSVWNLTLEEKIGQMTQANALDLGDGEDVARYMLGSVLSGGGGQSAAGNTPKDWADMVDGLQMQSTKTRLRIPILYGIDAVHGHNNVYGATIFPHNVGLGASRNPDLVKQAAIITAKEMLATGIRWTFAPCVAVCKDPRWGRCYESFGENTTLVKKMVSAVEGYQQNAVAAQLLGIPGSIVAGATVKHFIGDGGTLNGKDQGNTQMSVGELLEKFLPPYQAALLRGVAAVMISYSSWNGAKMHGSSRLITDVLKRDLMFPGVVVSDWAAIQQLPGDFNQQVRDSINAGIDLVMVPDDYVRFQEVLREEVLAHRVAEERVTDAAARVLKMKSRLGLFENACAKRELLADVGHPAHRALARKAVAESLVLLKNSIRPPTTGPILPLRWRGARILVAGPHANDVGLQCGGWTITWQGGVGNTTQGVTILEGVQAKVGSGAAQVQYAAQPSGKEEADFGIVVVGEQPYAEYKGDSSTLEMDASSVSAINAVCDNMPCVVVLISGRPLIIPPALLQKMDALIAAWLPGSEAGGPIAAALFSTAEEFDFVGRLPISWPRSVEQLPLDASKGPEEYDPLFKYGFGLNKANEVLPDKD